MRPRGFIETWRPQRKSLVLLDAVLGVLDQYADYLPLTLRQLFYRLVATIAYPKNEDAYERLSELVNKARRAGRISFSVIRDDGLTRDEPDVYQSIEHLHRTIVRAVSDYRLDRQLSQPVRTVAWCEAAGMVPQLARVAHPFSIPVLSSGGFDSTTIKYALAEEFAAGEKPVRVLHIGDYDPSGVHVIKNLDEDIGAFVERLSGREVEFVRVAILPEHVRRYALATDPRKAQDRRSFHGIDGDPDATVQCEALDPAILSELLETAIRQRWDPAAERAIKHREARDRRRLDAWLASFGGAP